MSLRVSLFCYQVPEAHGPEPGPPSHSHGRPPLRMGAQAQHRCQQHTGFGRPSKHDAGRRGLSPKEPPEGLAARAGAVLAHSCNLPTPQA